MSTKLFPIPPRSSEIEALFHGLLAGEATRKSQSAYELSCLAQELESAGDYLSGLRIYRRLYEIGFDTRRQAAHCLFLLGFYSDAAKEFRIALTESLSNNIHPWILMEYGMCLSKIGATGEDLNLINSLLVPDSTNFPVVATVLSEVFAHHKMWNKVIEWLSPLHMSNHSRLFTLLTEATIRHNFPHFETPQIKINAETSDGTRGAFKLGIACTSLSCYGRFGQTLTEYYFLQKLAKDFGRTFFVPSWVGELVFELNNPRYHGGFRQVNLEASEILEAIKLAGVSAIDGYDFFSPGSFATWSHEDLSYARSLFSFRPEVEQWCLYQLDSMKIDVTNLVAVHLRLGDQFTRTGTLDARIYRQIISRLLTECGDTTPYLATEDIPRAKEFLGSDNFLTSALAADAPVGLKWLIDFYVFTKARRVITHQSSFSYWGCILNTNESSCFFQPDLENNCFVEFDTGTYNTTKFVK